LSIYADFLRLRAKTAVSVRTPPTPLKLIRCSRDSDIAKCGTSLDGSLCGRGENSCVPSADKRTTVALHFLRLIFEI
jgi:hypothetical protein